MMNLFDRLDCGGLDTTYHSSRLGLLSNIIHLLNAMQLPRLRTIDDEASLLGACRQTA